MSPAASSCCSKFSVLHTVLTDLMDRGGESSVTRGAWSRRSGCTSWGPFPSLGSKAGKAQTLPAPGVSPYQQIASGAGVAQNCCRTEAPSTALPLPEGSAAFLCGPRQSTGLPSHCCPRELMLLSWIFRWNDFRSHLHQEQLPLLAEQRLPHFHTGGLLATEGTYPSERTQAFTRQVLHPALGKFRIL